MHPADIVASLKKRGKSLRALSAHYGYAVGTLQQALQRPYPKAERLIALALGMRPEQIWPSRYAAPLMPSGHRRRKPCAKGARR